MQTVQGKAWIKEQESWTDMNPDTGTKKTGFLLGIWAASKQRDVVENNEKVTCMTT